MKATLVFEINRSVALATGESLVLFMDCYQVTSEDKPFDKAFRFSWIAYMADDEDRRVLMDQHPGKAAHLHLDDGERGIEVSFKNKEEAVEYFLEEVQKHFGPISDEEI